MAVSIRFYSVLVRNDTIAARFPGGMKAFVKACPNATYCADDNISRVSFMAFDDAYAYAEWLVSLGLDASDDQMQTEIAIIREDKGQLTECDWPEFGLLDGRPAAWLAGTESGPVVALEIEKEYSDLRTPLSFEDLRRDYDLLGSDQGIETYREKATGKIIYISRTESGESPVSTWGRFLRRFTGGQS